MESTKEAKSRGKHYRSKRLKKINLGFTPELQVKWERWQFTYEEVKEWISVGLTLHEVGFVIFLENNGYRRTKIIK